MTFEVSEVHLQFITPNRGLIAIAKIVLNSALVIDGIGVYEKLNAPEYRLTYPNRNLQNGRVLTLVHPIQAELSHAIESAIFQKIVERKLKAVDSHDRYRQTHS
jgi:DNA-binding cell septation regulator SpoVG